MKPTATAAYDVKCVAKACDILAAVQSAKSPLKLQDIMTRTGLRKATAFRILATLQRKGLVQRAGTSGYRLSGTLPGNRRFRIGYAAQSSEFPFSRTVADSIVLAARAANIELVTADNRYSKSTAIRNAERFVREAVDLVIEFQTVSEIAPIIASKYHAANIPMIAVEIPHPGATFYGADNYRAGQIAGRHLGRWAEQNWQGEVDEILLLELPLAGPLPQSRITGALDGIFEVLPARAKARVIRLNGNGQYEASLHATRKHLRGAAGRNCLVAAVNDPSALGALRAFQEAGREQCCAVVGQNASEEARDELRRKRTRFIGSVAYFPENYGNEIIRIALEILNNKPVPPAVFATHRLITPANVDRFYPAERAMG